MIAVYSIDVLAVGITLIGLAAVTLIVALVHPRGSEPGVRPRDDVPPPPEPDRPARPTYRRTGW